MDWHSKTVCPLGNELLPTLPCMYGTSDGQGYLKVGWIDQSKLSAPWAANFCPYYNACMVRLMGKVIEVRMDWPSKTVCPLGSELLPIQQCMYGTSDGQGYLKLGWIGQAKLSAPWAANFCPHYHACMVLLTGKVRCKEYGISPIQTVTIRLQLRDSFSHELSIR
jgi:hypothetical protein